MSFRAVLRRVASPSSSPLPAATASPASTSAAAAAAAAAVVAATTTTIVVVAATTTKPMLADDEEEERRRRRSSRPPPPRAGLIETDLVDRIASKPYVNYHNSSTPSLLLRPLVGGGDDGAAADGRPLRGRGGWFRGASRGRAVDPYDGYDEYFSSGSDPDSASSEGRCRPRGVPRRLRILSVDVPEMREAFDGECRLNLSRVFPDGIAPDKIVKVPSGGRGGGGGGRRRKKKKKKKRDDAPPAAHSPPPSPVSDEEEEADADAAGTPEKETEEEEATDSKRNGDDEEEEEERNDDAEVDVDDVDVAAPPTLEVIQKSLARSVVRCRNRRSKKIGVELLETSVADLNPKNLRRAAAAHYRRFGGMRFDPDRRRRRQKQSGDADAQSRGEGDERGKGNGEDATEGTEEVRGGGTGGGGKAKEIAATEEEEETVPATTYDDELDAPWNQYAWIEEMELRIAGRVPFGGPVERSSRLSRAIFGNTYRTTIPSSRSYLSYVLPSFLLGGSNFGGDDGIDGDVASTAPNRASHKPHAVVANGSAMLRVPGSLRHLSKRCAESGVPLFVVNDPRVWGGNTHADLADAVSDARRAIKGRIVSNVLTIKEGSMFERGRALGRMETDARWKAKDLGRRTRKAVRDMQDRIRREREDDWSNLGSEELRERLSERGAVWTETVEEDGDGDGEPSSRRRDSDRCTEGMAELCKACLQSEALRRAGRREEEEEEEQEGAERAGDEASVEPGDDEDDAIVGDDATMGF